MCSQKWNCAASVPIPTFMFLWPIYIYLGSVHIFGCNSPVHPTVGLQERQIWAGSRLFWRWYIYEGGNVKSESYHKYYWWQHQFMYIQWWATFKFIRLSLYLTLRDRLCGFFFNGWRMEDGRLCSRGKRDGTSEAPANQKPGLKSRRPLFRWGIVLHTRVQWFWLFSHFDV